jgi:hypothetical protein
MTDTEKITALERCIYGVNGTPGMLTALTVLQGIVDKTAKTADSNTAAIQNLVTSVTVLTEVQTGLEAKTQDIDKHGTTWGKTRHARNEGADVDTVKHSQQREDYTVPIVIGIIFIAIEIALSFLLP